MSEQTLPEQTVRIRARAIILAIVLTAVCGIWVRQAEIVVLSTQVTESVPPIPALAVLLVLVGLNPLLALIGPRLALTRAELLAIYCFVSVAISMLGVGVVRFWLALLTHAFYFANTTNGFAALFPAFPSWLAVKDPKAIHDLYVRSRTGTVPWSIWMGPLAVWTGFFCVLWAGMLCMVLLVRRRWVDAERLTFPIVELPLEITGGSTHRNQPRFFRDPIMWAGFGLACAYNLWNIAQAMWPSLPAPGKLLDLTPIVRNSDWRGLGTVELWYRPELIGFGILVPSEILFSIWFFYVVSKVEGLVAVRQAVDVPGVPFEQEQSIGAFLLLALYLLWDARGDIFRSVRPPGGRREPGDAPWWALPGLIASVVLTTLFCTAAGMAWWAGLAFLVVVLLTALVVARIRAQAGVPLIWLFPFYQQKKILLYSLGTAAFIGGRLPIATLTIFALLTFLSRGYFPSLIGYQIEGLKIADEARMSRRTMCGILILAAAVGLVVAYYYHLTPYYRYGAQNLREGIWGTEMADQEYTDVVSAMTTPQHADLYRIGASTFGALLTAAMLLLRRTFVGFPLHPVGYAVANAYGTLVWWPFLVTWVAKVLILRYGGMPIYRRAVPGFLGFALGHFFLAGAVWGLLGAVWQEGARAYPVWFG